MFSYYGTKKKLSKNYPKPRFGKIIEPFCGAAMYSLHDNHWENDVILYDKYDKIFIAWDYLINRATVNDIKNLPNLKEGLNLDTINISNEEKVLLGFFCNPSSAVPKKTVTKRGEVSWERHKNNLLENLHKIKHWKIFNKSFLEIENEKATWFIDPPYQYGGKYYHSSVNNTHIDFNFLGEWCKERNGDIIVCENSKANWLPFEPLVKLKGQLHTTMEVMYHKKN